MVLFTRLTSLLFSLLMMATSSAQYNFFKDLLHQHGSSQLKTILDQPDTFRYQLIYTKIDRDKNNKPHFTQYKLQVNREEYFNPASMVKIPLAFMALEKMNKLKSNGIDEYSPILTDCSFSGQFAVTTDTSAENGLPSLAHYIKKVFLVSNNDAYNRLYEFLGQQYLNERLWKNGIQRYSHHQALCPDDEGRKQAH